MYLQSGAQCSFQIGGDRLRIAVPPGCSHAFAHTFEDVCAGIRCVESLQEGQDFLKVLDILLRNLLPKVGDSFSFGDAQVQFLSPMKEYSNINDSSIVVRIIHGINTFLFAGDAEWEAEHDMVDSGYDLSATVLKVGHHGSDTSSSYVFLREVMPKYAVISCGEGNSYGHPTEAVLSRLRDVGAQVFRTDLQGDVVFVSDGTTLSFGTEKYADAQMLWKSGGVTN